MVIVAADIVPNLGGIEFAEDIVLAMDLDRAAKADPSLARLLDDLKSLFHEWLSSASQ